MDDFERLYELGRKVYRNRHNVKRLVEINKDILALAAAMDKRGVPIDDISRALQKGEHDERESK